MASKKQTLRPFHHKTFDGHSLLIK